MKILFKDLSFKIIWHRVLILIDLILIVCNVMFFIEYERIFIGLFLLTINCLKPKDRHNHGTRLTDFFYLILKLIVFLSGHFISKNNSGAWRDPLHNFATHNLDVRFVARNDKFVFVVDFQVYFFAFKKVFIFFDWKIGDFITLRFFVGLWKKVGFLFGEEKGLLF